MLSIRCVLNCISQITFYIYDGYDYHSRRRTTTVRYKTASSGGSGKYINSLGYELRIKTKT